jgi:hypothetical protein
MRVCKERDFEKQKRKIGALIYREGEQENSVGGKQLRRKMLTLVLTRYCPNDDKICVKDFWINIL